MAGMCHVFALALHEALDFSFLVLLNRIERFPGDTTPSVQHVYALDGLGSAYDFLGRHDVGDVLAEWQRIAIHPNRPDVAWLSSEKELREHVQSSRPIWDRPLAFYTKADVRHALQVAQERLGSELPALLGGVSPAPGR